MRRIAVVAAWVGVTFLTAVAAWSAVNIAGGQVADRPVLPLSSAEVEALPVTPATDPPDAPPAAVAPATTTTTRRSATTTVPSTATSAASSTTTSSARVTSTSVAPPRSTSTTSTTSPATTTSSSTTTTTSPATTTTVVAAQASVHQLIGGVVSIEASPAGVSLLSASPAAGFTVEVKNGGPSQVEIEFESQSHESKFKAKWDGRLVVDIEEEPED